MANSIVRSGANDRDDYGPGAVLNLSGTPPGPGSGRITVNDRDLFPPPIGTPDGDVLTANASAPGGMDWEASGGSSFATIGLLLSASGLSVDAASGTLLPDLSMWTIAFQSGFTVNGDNTVTITQKGRYQIIARSVWNRNATVAQEGGFYAGYSRSYPGIRAIASLPIAAVDVAQDFFNQVTTTFLDVVELDINDTVNVQFIGASTDDTTAISISAATLTLQYVGPTVSI